MNHFKNKVIWITGASSGIGASLAVELSAYNCKLILSGRNQAALQAVKNNCIGLPQENIRLLPFDLKESENIPAITEQAIGLFGEIDITILNGGIAQRSLTKDTTLAVDRELMEVDYFSCIAITKSLLPHLMERNKGQIVVVSSVMGIIGTPFRSGYAAAKHALHGFYDSLRAELWYKYKGITVTIVAPGWVRTNITMNALSGDGSRLQSMDRATEKGMDPEKFAKKMVRAIAGKKNLAIIGGVKERFAVWLQRYFPELFIRLVRVMNVR